MNSFLCQSGNSRQISELSEGRKQNTMCVLLLFECCVVLAKLLPLYDTWHYTRQCSAILQILVRLHILRSVLILISVLNYAYTRVVYSPYSYIDPIRTFLWKYKLRGIERFQWWPVSGLRPAFPSKDFSTPFSNRPYVHQLGLIRVVKEILIIIIIRVHHDARSSECQIR
jgi:hypothetical protein